MVILQLLLISATFLCSLVAGFLFAFSVVVFPGITQLNDKEFIRSFQFMDGVIQRNQPFFMIVWVGSILTIIALGALGSLLLDGLERNLIVLSVLVYLLGVQLPTITVNVPLNNRLQSFNVDESNDQTFTKERQDFEPRWTRWNAIRTVFACITSLTLIVLLVEL